MIVWLVEAIKNLHPCIVLNTIYLSYAFYCEVDPYYHCQYTTGNYFQYTHCLWQLITLYVVEFMLLPCVFHVPLKNLLINSFDSYQVFVLEDKPFLYGTLCHCEKCREFGLFVRTLLFWEFAISFLPLCFICLNEITLWACVFYLIIYAQWFFT